MLDEDSGEILRWHAGWLERKFPVDMNAFCFHTSYLLVRCSVLRRRAIMLFLSFLLYSYCTKRLCQHPPHNIP